jgi:hypothetical protein
MVFLSGWLSSLHEKLDLARDTNRAKIPHAPKHDEVVTLKEIGSCDKLRSRFRMLWSCGPRKFDEHAFWFSSAYRYALMAAAIGFSRFAIAPAEQMRLTLIPHGPSAVVGFEFKKWNAITRLRVRHQDRQLANWSRSAR